MNQKLLSAINASGKLHMVPASLNGRFVIRFCVCAQDASHEDIVHAYNVISQFASDLFEILNLEKDLQEPEKKEEDETADEVIVLDRKKKTSLRYKRSFFVRMVSDPKLYNPKIVKTLSSSSNDNESDVFSPL